MSAILTIAKVVGADLARELLGSACEDLHDFVDAMQFNKTRTFKFRLPFGKKTLKTFNVNVRKTRDTVTFRAGGLSIPVKVPLSDLKKACSVIISDVIND